MVECVSFQQSQVTAAVQPCARESRQAQDRPVKSVRHADDPCFPWAGRRKRSLSDRLAKLEELGLSSLHARALPFGHRSLPIEAAEAGQSRDTCGERESGLSTPGTLLTLASRRIRPRFPPGR